MQRFRRKRRKQLGHKKLQYTLGSTVRRRHRAIRAYRAQCRNKSEQEAAEQTGRCYKVSPSTIRRWHRLYKDGGLEALLPKPTGPKSVEHQIPKPVQMVVVALRLLYGWNEKRIAKELKQRGIATISHTSVGRIFQRYHLPTRTYHAKSKSDGLKRGRYEKRSPNKQWHLDFTETKLADGTRVVILVIVDDYSRFCIECKVVSGMTADAAIKAVQEACQNLDIPYEIVTDNGRAFTTIFEDTLTSFGKHLEQAGINHHLTSPYYPEANGKVEAFIKTLKRECLNKPFDTIEQLETAMEEFILYYNHIRLHSSLEYQTPVSRFLGVKTVANHGLGGLPGLPAQLLEAFPPQENILYHSVDTQSLKRQFALASIFL
jgi:putative transposase